MDIPRDFCGLQEVARDSHGFSSLKHLDLSNTSGQCSCVFQGIRKKRVLTMHVTDVPKPPSLTRRVALHQGCLLGASALSYHLQYCGKLKNRPSNSLTIWGSIYIMPYIWVYHNIPNITPLFGYGGKSHHPWHGLYSPHARFTGSNFLIELIAIVATTAPKFLGVCILQIRNLVGFCMVLPRIFVDTPIDGLTSSYGCFLIWGYPKI